MTEQNLSISGRSLVGSRFAKSKKNFINSYAYVQANASMSKRHTVSTDLALMIEVGTCYCYISVKDTDSVSLRDALYQEILKKERHYSSYKPLNSEEHNKNMNILKWIFLHWDKPVINHPVKKVFPDVSQEFKTFVDAALSVHQHEIHVAKAVKQDSQKEFDKFIVGNTYSVPYGTSYYQATFIGLSSIYKGKQMGKFVFLFNGSEKETHVILEKVQFE